MRKGVPWVDYKGEKKGEVIAEDFLWGLEWVLNFAKNDALNTSMPKQLLEGATEYYEYTKELGEEAKNLDLAKFKEMVGIEVPNDYTLKFECLDTFPYFQTGVRTFFWTFYATKPRLLRYSIGLLPPKDILIRSS